MTREEILKLKPGRKLDALVAEFYMEWKWVEEDGRKFLTMKGVIEPFALDNFDENGLPYFLPTYSQSDGMGQAWVLAQLLADEWPDFNIYSRWNEQTAEFEGWHVAWGMDGHGWDDVQADTANLAICYVALITAQEVIRP